MRKRLKHFFLCTLCLLLLSCLALSVCATDPQAQDISGQHLITDHSGFPSLSSLFDGVLTDGWRTEETASLTLEFSEGIGSLYLIFEKGYGPCTIINNDTGETIGAKEMYVHQFVDLQSSFGAAPTSITIRLDGGPVRLNELFVYTPGAVPDTVQKWEAPKDGETDLLLFATHSDDDQLFFAGILPFYAVERGYQVQVVYLTDHHNTAAFRVHEMLNGLWAVGIRSYPVFGEYDDFGNAMNLQDAFRIFQERGWSREEMTGFVVEQLRRFKPQVAIGHDLNGEYGHAQHKAYAQLLIDAVEISADHSFHPESAERYGVWDVPKTYLHLYAENPIVMDWDQPMAHFDGKTPYEVTRDLGFAAHTSQHAGWGWYFQGADTAAEIPHYSPCEFGLYRTTVGEDVQKNDFFENVNSYAEQARQAEEAARLEAERLAEEEARLEAERMEAERLEAERLEAERLEAERLEAQKQTEIPVTVQPATDTQEEGPITQSGPLLYIGLGIGALTLVAIALVLRKILKPGKYSSKKYKLIGSKNNLKIFQKTLAF